MLVMHTTGNVDIGPQPNVISVLAVEERGATGTLAIMRTAKEAKEVP